METTQNINQILPNSSSTRKSILKGMSYDEYDDFREAHSRLPFDSYQGPFPVQEYVECTKSLEKPEEVDKNVFIYENIRQICIDFNPLIVWMEKECKCKEMNSNLNTFLCAAHSTPNPCNAMDYCRHTLDGAIALLNSNKAFPSRNSVDPTQFKSIMRRLYRLFLHCWAFHLEIFMQVQAENQCYSRFVGLCLKYEILPESTFIIPSEDYE